MPPSIFRRFLRRYGWRAYAMPVLAALTVVLVTQIGQTPAASMSSVGGTTSGGLSGAPVDTNVPPSPLAGQPGAHPDAADAESLQSEADGANVLSAPSASDAAKADPVANATAGGQPAAVPADVQAPSAAAGLSPALAVGALPDGDPFAERGDGTYRIIAGAGPRAGISATVVTYTVEIENGFEPAGGDRAFASFVEATLADPRSWTAVKGISLERMVSADAAPDFRVTLGSQQTVRGMCGYAVHLESSCYTRTEGRVMINDARWVRGALSYTGDLTSYRRYAVNHEVGHALGYGHEPCPVNGGPAPVMMQQSWSTSNDQLAAINGSVSADGNACAANPWPDPAAAADQGSDATDTDPAQPTG